MGSGTITMHEIDGGKDYDVQERVTLQKVASGIAGVRQSWSCHVPNTKFFTTTSKLQFLQDSPDFAFEPNETI